MGVPTCSGGGELGANVDVADASSRVASTEWVVLAHRGLLGLW
ncbi:hypothetical protein [Salinispora arenicola]|nr:hypothetical protein [Salinispora arenicola]